MKDLFSFLNNASDTSDFKAKLSERGGFITFSNSADVVELSSSK